MKRQSHADKDVLHSASFLSSESSKPRWYVYNYSLISEFPNRNSMREVLKARAHGVFSYQFSSVAQSCLMLCDPMEYSLPGALHHGISQARILEWVAISCSRGSSRLRGQTRVSCIAGRFFTTELQGSQT